jgi:hypothetical protein
LRHDIDNFKIVEEAVESLKEVSDCMACLNCKVVRTIHISYLLVVASLKVNNFGEGKMRDSVSTGKSYIISISKNVYYKSAGQIEFFFYIMKSFQLFS